MSRTEFSKATKRDALTRSQMRCEALGAWYGMEAEQRCNAPLAYGVEFDHIILDNISSDNSLDNCAAVCIPCHRFKTAKVDVPKAAKTKRQRDKDLGIHKPKSSFATNRNGAFKKRMDGSVERR